MKKQTVTCDKRCAPAAIDLRAELPEALEKLKGFAMHLVRDRREAEDLLQETAVRALSSEHQFDNTTALGAWLYVIMKNEFLTRCRRKKRQPAPLDTTPEEFFARPESQTSAVFLKEVRSLVGELHHTQAFALNGLADGLSYEQITAKLQCSMGTTKSRVSRGRAALERMVA